VDSPVLAGFWLLPAHRLQPNLNRPSESGGM
jgi:hypothetical protein